MNERTFINLRKKIHNLKMMGTDSLTNGPVLDEICFRIKNLPGPELLASCEALAIKTEIGAIMDLIKSIEKKDSFNNNLIYHDRTGLSPQRKIANVKKELEKFSLIDPVLNNRVYAIKTSKNVRLYDVLKLSFDLKESGDSEDSLKILNLLEK